MMEDRSRPINPDAMLGIYLRINELKQGIKSAKPFIDDSEIGLKMKANIEWSSKYVMKLEAELLSQIELKDLQPYTTE
jgi:hypothetical protein